jgi:hypothetical protein
VLHPPYFKRLSNDRKVAKAMDREEEDMHLPTDMLGGKLSSVEKVQRTVRKKQKDQRQALPGIPDGLDQSQPRMQCFPEPPPPRAARGGSGISSKCGLSTSPGLTAWIWTTGLKPVQHKRNWRPKDALISRS